MKFSKTLSITFFLISYNVTGQVASGLMSGAQAALTIDAIGAELDNIRSNIDVSLDAKLYNLLETFTWSVNQMKSTGDHWMNKAGYILDKEEQQIINDLQNQARSLIEAVNAKAEDRISQASIDLSDAISKTWFGQKRATVFQYTFPTIINDSNDRDVILIFKGTYIHNKNNKLIIDSKEYAPIARNQREIQFLIPKREFLFGLNRDDLQNKQIGLKLYKKPKFLRKNDKLAENLSFNLRVVPEVIGTFQVKYQIRYDSIIRRRYQGTNRTGCTSSRLDNCTANGSVTIRPPKDNLLGREGVQFYVDVESPEISVIDSRGPGQCNGASRVSLSTVNQDGVTVNAHMRSHTGSGSRKRCFSTFGASFYIVARLPDITETISSDTESIFTNRDESFVIDDPSHQIRFLNFENVVFTSFDGSQSIFTPGSNSNSVMSADFINGTRQVVLRARLRGFQ